MRISSRESPRKVTGFTTELYQFQYIAQRPPTDTFCPASKGHASALGTVLDNLRLNSELACPAHEPSCCQWRFGGGRGEDKQKHEGVGCEEQELLFLCSVIHSRNLDVYWNAWIQSSAVHVFESGGEGGRSAHPCALATLVHPCTSGFRTLKGSNTFRTLPFPKSGVTTPGLGNGGEGGIRTPVAFPPI